MAPEDVVNAIPNAPIFTCVRQASRPVVAGCKPARLAPGREGTIFHSCEAV